MDRRHFQLFALALGLPALLGTPTHAANPPSEEPALDDLVMGLRSLLDVVTDEALSDLAAAQSPAFTTDFTARLRHDWGYGQWAMERTRPQTASPWRTYANFEAVAQRTARRLWPLAHQVLMLQVHQLVHSDLMELVTSRTITPESAFWATRQLLRRSSGALHSRLLGEVVNIQLEWLREQTDRYLNNPAARNAQVEVEDFEACIRTTRALVDSIFHAIAQRERAWRQAPEAANVPTRMKAALQFLGPAPEADMLPMRRMLALPTDREKPAEPSPATPSKRKSRSR